MGKLAGATLTAVAPEAKLASKVAGAGGRRRPVPDPRVAAPGSKAARDRQMVEDIKAARPPEPDPTPAPGPATGPSAAPSPSPQGAGLSMPSMPAAAGTGSGVLLGLFTWGLVLSYLGVNGDKSGMAGVRAFMAAKFFNKV